MSSAVGALREAQLSAAGHGKSSRYRAWCMCCAPGSQDVESKGRAASRPKLAWRQRLEAQQALLAESNDSALGKK